MGGSDDLVGAVDGGAFAVQEEVGRLDPDPAASQGYIDDHSGKVPRVPGGAAGCEDGMQGELDQGGVRGSPFGGEGEAVDVLFSRVLHGKPEGFEAEVGFVHHGEVGRGDAEDGRLGALKIEPAVDGVSRHAAELEAGAGEAGKVSPVGVPVGIGGTDGGRFGEGQSAQEGPRSLRRGGLPL